MVQANDPDSPETAAEAAAAIAAAAGGSPAELRAEALQFASMLTEVCVRLCPTHVSVSCPAGSDPSLLQAVVRQLTNPEALKASALNGTKVTQAVADRQHKPVKTKRRARTDKYNAFLLYASLMGAHTVSGIGCGPCSV